MARDKTIKLLKRLLRDLLKSGEAVYVEKGNHKVYKKIK